MAMIRKLLVFKASRSAGWGALMIWVVGLMCGLVPGPARADTLVGTNGLSLTGEIVSMSKGELVFKTQVGTHTLPMAEVSSFVIDRTSSIQVAGSSSINSSTGASGAGTEEILARLDTLTATLENLQRQLLMVQSAQATQANQIEQRTLDYNPQSNIEVRNTRMARKTTGTVITGQVLNKAAAPMSGVQVEVVVYGHVGRLRSKGGERRLVVPVDPPIIEPGQTGSFSAQFESGLLVGDYKVFPRLASPAGYNSALPNQPNANRF